MPLATVIEAGAVILISLSFDEKKGVSTVILPLIGTDVPFTSFICIFVESENPYPFAGVNVICAV